MGIFGWSLPPGVSMNDIDPPDRPCEVCGKFTDDCICQECPKCSSYGDPKCYEKHGLVRTKEQKASFKEYQKKEKEFLKRERKMCQEMARDYKKNRKGD
jgi:hypothetical protein